jgi:DNA-directed RNA polymerase specialized sigma subunit
VKLIAKREPIVHTRKELEEIIPKLPARDQYILMCTLPFPTKDHRRLQSDLATIMGISTSRVSQLSRHLKRCLFGPSMEYKKLLD